MTAFFNGRTPYDWLFMALVAAGGVFALARFASFMDIYEKGVLLCSLPALVALAWSWPVLRTLTLGVFALASLAIWLYQDPAGTSFGPAWLARAEQSFLLRYFLSSQASFLWMSVLFALSTLLYWLGLVVQKGFEVSSQIASQMAWGGVTAALTGTLVRWFESYLVGLDVGHIPVSNLYEVFVLFCWLTTALYLYYEQFYNTRRLGAFVMLIVCAAVGFVLWYSFSREAHDIQPLVPALQSWWMKVHVPANFIGYGTFALAAMVAGAYLIKSYLPHSAFARALPTLALLDDWMYKGIAVGFVFFTVATVLGAFWAAEAWGGYWSWDPKETWALIVWLNYAAWLHMHLIKGLRGNFAAWWALIGLLVTSFAFIGVNMFLSGLHSYGTL